MRATRKIIFIFGLGSKVAKLCLLLNLSILEYLDLKVFDLWRQCRRQGSCPKNPSLVFSYINDINSFTPFNAFDHRHCNGFSELRGVAWPYGVALRLQSLNDISVFKLMKKNFDLQPALFFFLSLSCIKCKRL